jgi:hypothetical protein
MRRTALKLAALAIIIAIFAIGQAHAAVTPPPEGWGAAFLNTAREYWGHEPTNCTSLSIEFDATSFETGDSGGEATEPETPEACVMRVKHLSAFGECEVTVHEYGHLLGYGHSTDPSSIMYPELTLQNRLAICEKLTLPPGFFGRGKKAHR